MVRVSRRPGNDGLTNIPRVYRVYGLAVEGRLPRSYSHLATRGRPDVRLRPGQPNRFENAARFLNLPVKPADWFECHRLNNGTTYLRWADLFEFLISRNARTIEYRRLKNATDESLATYLLGQVLAFALVARGHEPLHATAVVIDGEAIAFLGDCGYGKSTLGAAFLARGYPILTDDVLVLEAGSGRWRAHAGPPRVKLFPSVARKVLARGRGDRLNPGTSKLVLPLTRTETHKQVPITALYVLPGPTRSQQPRTRRVRVEAIGGQDAFVEIIRSAFDRIQVDETRLRTQFSAAARLATEVPMRRLIYPRALSQIGAVCDAVIADAAAVRRRRAAV
jgi:hypothetical protein